ncbi:MAG: hydantoinase B/oxoprolinase family protein, partial [Rhodospirillales bacterium]|nr:hydantoinase B/oxoprolinase family protein [Rhodospirillales bacterium]
TLSTFGGAGGQHACLVADALGMTRVFAHPFAGVLSAYGMGLADLRTLRERAVEAVLEEALLPVLDRQLAVLEDEARAEMAGQGVTAERMSRLRKVLLRYAGSDTGMLVDFAGRDAMLQAFEAAHRARYGFVMADKPLVVEALSVEVIGHTEAVLDREAPLCPRNPAPRARSQVFTEGIEHDTPVFAREDFGPGDRVDGPAIIVERTATTMVEPGWQAEITGRDHLVLNRIRPRPKAEALGTKADPVMLEVFNNLFMSIAEQMGAALANTAHSVNIKERLDFSCAVFDGAGQLIANAPHIPVHLGSMGESVRAVIRARRQTMRPGDVYCLNTPYNGGTHLPDVTVVTPVFDATAREVLFYVGARGHHADIGGITPGSMPPMSTGIDQEGVLIDDFLLVEAGRFREAELVALLSSGPYPARNPVQNVADLKAQIAACEKGARELRRMVGHFGLEVVRAYMGHVQDNAEESVRCVLDVLHDGAFVNEMDDGSRIRVRIAIDKARRRAVIDFTGTSPQRPGNVNAPAAVTHAAVLYVFRTLVEQPIPLNAGCLKPLDIIIPEGSMLRPRPPAAVVAGNVETSQAVTDALYGALGVLASAQGTMNNFTFGNERYQYYETICGGSGAGPDFDGTAAVQTHMTNSRLTDPEVLEWRFPVLVEEFRIRHGSGGPGRQRGGDGVVR